MKILTLIAAVIAAMISTAAAAQNSQFPDVGPETTICTTAVITEVHPGTPGKPCRGRHCSGSPTEYTVRANDGSTTRLSANEQIEVRLGNDTTPVTPAHKMGDKVTTCRKVSRSSIIN